VYDPTQGPACALACAPGTVFRNYFAPTQRPDGKMQVGQTRDAQINNLRGIEELLQNDEHQFFRSHNGYVLSEGIRLERLNEALVKLDRDTLMAALRIGFHGVDPS
jgi:hypothetical protein